VARVQPTLGQADPVRGVEPAGLLADHGALCLAQPPAIELGHEVTVIELVGVPIEGVEGDLATRHDDTQHVGLLHDARLIGVGGQIIVHGTCQVLRRKPRVGHPRDDAKLIEQMLPMALERAPQRLRLNHIYRDGHESLLCRLKNVRRGASAMRSG
jgi:hypothetical protein